MSLNGESDFVSACQYHMKVWIFVFHNPKVSLRNSRTIGKDEMPSDIAGVLVQVLGHTVPIRILDILNSYQWSRASTLVQAKYQGYCNSAIRPIVAGQESGLSTKGLGTLHCSSTAPPQLLSMLGHSQAYTLQSSQDGPWRVLPLRAPAYQPDKSAAGQDWRPLLSSAQLYA